MWLSGSAGHIRRRIVSYSRGVMDQNETQQPIAAPVAERRPQQGSHHGIQRADDYAWLRADNWQEVMRDPAALAEDIRGYLLAENAYTEAVLDRTTALQETLFKEMKGRIKEDDFTVPSPDGPWAYFVSFVTGGQHPLFCREPRDGGEDRSCSTATRWPKVTPISRSAACCAQPRPPAPRLRGRR